MFTHLRRLWRNLLIYLRNLNLFPSVPPSINEFDLRNEIISTRLFVLLFILSVSILLGYITLVKVTKIGVVNAPTVEQYSDLYSTYSHTLTCPCTTISVKYEKFLKIQYTLHQVCNSTSIIHDWTVSSTKSFQDQHLTFDDFRMLSPYIFQGVTAFCQNVDTAISYSLSLFYLNEYITMTVTSRKSFESESESLMQQFISLTTNRFLFTLQTISDTTQANALVSAIQNNYLFIFFPNSQQASTLSMDYYGCSCMVSAKCVEPSSIYDLNNYTTLFTVPGVYLGCTVIEALLQSTLECFYNQTCIDIIQSYMVPSDVMNVSALESSLSSRFSVNSTVQELVDRLMVEKWNLSSIYEKYYAECQPLKCSYIYVTRNDVIYIVTTFLGLVGGLISILKFLIPRLVKLIARLVKFKRRNTRMSQVENGNISILE